MQRFMLLMPLFLAVFQAAVHGYNYNVSSKKVTMTGLRRQNSDDSDISQIAHILHPPSSKGNIHKDIFTFSPPDMELSEAGPAVMMKVEPAFKRRIKIIFIRSPDLTQDLTTALAKLVKGRTDQKTIIYVLNKQPDLSELANKLQNLKQQNPNKPEVHFVKYRTAAEAVMAMRNIQIQYESLGGSSRVHGAELASLLKISTRRTG